MNLRALPLALMAAGLIPLVGAQTASPETLALEFDADELVFRNVEPLVGEDAADVRQEIDEDHGNDDGTVTAAEVRAHRDANRMTFDRDDPDCFEDFFAGIGGKTPKRVAEVSSEYTGATGRVSSEAELQEHQVIRFLYPSPSSNRPKVSVAAGDLASLGRAIGCYMGNNFDYTGFQNYGQYPRGSWPASETVTTDTLTVGADQQSSSNGDGDTVLIIRPIGSASIDHDSVRPESARALWDGRGLRADTDPERAAFSTREISFTVEGGATVMAPWSGTARDIGAIVGFSLMGAGLLTLGAASLTEFGRYKLLKLLLLVPGFTRLEKDEVLEHSKRDELYRFIKTSPGPSFSDLRRELGLSNGTLVHHLRILEGQEYVKSVRDGFRTRFYVRGPKIVPTSYLTRTQQQLLEAIGANPGLTQKDLSLVLGLPRESVSYHTKQLAQKGKLEIKQDGKWRRYWPSTNAGPVLAGGQTS